MHRRSYATICVQMAVLHIRIQHSTHMFQEKVKRQESVQTTQLELRLVAKIRSESDSVQQTVAKLCVRQCFPRFGQTQIGV